MLREIQALGFDLIELGHGIRISLMPGIQKMVDAGEVRISSLHNFCPLPVEIMSASPDCYEFSAARKSERDRAVKQTLQTLDFAARLDAPFVVLHCGSIPMNPITDELIALAQNGGLLSRKYVQKKIGAVRTREQAAPAHLARVKECLKPIVERQRHVAHADRLDVAAEGVHARELAEELLDRGIAEPDLGDSQHDPVHHRAVGG